ncbi:MAG: PspA/IM30 family protein [Coleofasciculaceae cyanobacterium]
MNRLIDQAKNTDNPEKFSASFAAIKLSIQQEIAGLTKSKKLQQQQLKFAQGEVDLWQKVAIAALKQERDDLARKALERKLEHQQNITIITTQLEQVTARIESLKSNLLVIKMTINAV